jgi:predicted PurR-regulated permease PerM
MRPSTARLVLTPTTVVLVFGAIVVAVVLRNVFVEARRPIGWAIAALVMAAAIEPLVSLVSRHMRRGLALVCVLVPLLAAVGLVGRGVYQDLDSSIDKLKQALPDAAHDIEQSPRFGKAAKDLQLEHRAQRVADTLKKPSSQVAGAAVGSAGAYLVTTILMIFALGWGPRFGSAALHQIEDEGRRDRLARVVGEAFSKSQAYVDTMLAQGLFVGLLSWILFRVFDVPAPTPLAVLLGVLSLVPFVGIFVGALPAVMLEAGFETFGRAALLLAIMLMLQLLQVVIYQGVTRRTLYIGPAVTVIAYLVGSGIYGVGGAIVTSAVAVFGIALVDAARAERGGMDLPPEEADPTLDREPDTA